MELLKTGKTTRRGMHIKKYKSTPQPPNQRLQTMRFALPLNAMPRGPHV